MKDFELSKFVICTDAGLSSESNRKFNNFGERSFITAPSIKKLNNLKEWCLEPTGWSLEGHKKKYDISKLEDTPENKKKTFYKEKLIEGYDEERDIEFNQTLIVTYSLKYKEYQTNIRARQIQRAENAINNKSKIEKIGQNDYKRFIQKTTVTDDGEIAEKKVYALDLDTIAEEAKYDGFYAVCTNLDDDPAVIAKINHNRWKIEESFRIMKSEFKARPLSGCRTMITSVRSYSVMESLKSSCGQNTWKTAVPMAMNRSCIHNSAITSNRMSKSDVLPCISTANPVNRWKLTGRVILQQSLFLIPERLPKPIYLLV